MLFRSVSRQAVSRWELDEAAPETGKLLTLAEALQITADQLLRGEPNAPPLPAVPPAKEGFFARLARRRGWLAGVYVALSGLGVTAAALAARWAVYRLFAVTMSEAIDAMFFGMVPAEEIPPEWAGRFLGLTRTGGILANIAVIFAVAGGLIAVGGMIWAAVLYRKGRCQHPIQ